VEEAAAAAKAAEESAEAKAAEEAAAAKAAEEAAAAVSSKRLDQALLVAGAAAGRIEAAAERLYSAGSQWFSVSTAQEPPLGGRFDSYLSGSPARSSNSPSATHPSRSTGGVPGDTSPARPAGTPSPKPPTGTANKRATNRLAAGLPVKGSLREEEDLTDKQRAAAGRREAATLAKRQAAKARNERHRLAAERIQQGASIRRRAGNDTRRVIVDGNVRMTTSS
jgi:hypothetical protein